MSLFLMWNLLSGCATGPVFDGIETVTVHRQDSRGTSKVPLTGQQLDKVRSCLYKTNVISEDDATEQFLGSVVLMEVKDKSANRMFELFTQENFKGNKGTVYSNHCLYRLLVK